MKHIYNLQKIENSSKMKYFLTILVLLTFLVIGTGFSATPIYNVTGTSVCAGGSATIGLEDTDFDIVYHLLRKVNGIYTHVTLQNGQGIPITYADQTLVGIYEVWEYDDYTNDVTLITGSGIKQNNEVYIYALPVPVIEGNPTVCPNSSGNIYFTAPDKSNYIWSVTGGTITAGGGTNTVTVTWGATGSGNVYVSYTENGCNTATPTDYQVTIKSPVLNSTSNTEYLIIPKVWLL
jgi:hypothetical protein